MLYLRVSSEKILQFEVFSTAFRSQKSANSGKIGAFVQHLINTKQSWVLYFSIILIFFFIIFFNLRVGVIYFLFHSPLNYWQFQLSLLTFNKEVTIKKEVLSSTAEMWKYCTLLFF